MSTLSKQAYIDIQPKIKPSEELILKAIRCYSSMTLRQVAERLQMPLQTASARLSELHDKGLVMQNVDGQYYNTPNDDIEGVRRIREKNRFNKWQKLGEKLGYFDMIEQQRIDELGELFDEYGNEITL